MQDYFSRMRRESLVRKEKHASAPPSEEERLLEDIREVKRQLKSNHAFFAMESDEDLLDAAIYQREALQARYRYLLRRARETGAAAAGLPVEAEQSERWIS